MRHLSRRGFLEAIGWTAGALVVEAHLPGCRRSAGSFAPNAWLRITSDNGIVVFVEPPELGQGSRTYVPMMIAEELEVDWSAVHVEQAPTDPAIYRNLRTGGSGGVAHMFAPMRRAGAQAREMLISAAARRWNIAREQLRAERGAVVHGPSGRRVEYGDLVAIASGLPIPGHVQLKSPEQLTMIGTAIPRTDVPGKVDGSAIFGIDVRAPGMLFAVIARCPVFGGKLASLDRTAALAVPGVRAVFAVPPLPRRYNTAGGVAVVADSTWAAMQGRNALVLAWDSPPGEAETTERLRERVKARADGPPTFMAIDRGDAALALERSARTIEADYESPFQAHATMEPMNTTVHVRERDVEVWSPTQFADEVQAEIAALAGVPTEHVVVHMTLSGGSFGRRYQWDYAAEAWQVAKEMRRPVQLVWTREDDMQHDFYRPYSYQRLRGGFDDRGRLVAWSTRVVTTPIAATNLYTGQADPPSASSDPATVASLEWFGGDAAPYAVPNVHLDYAPAESVVPRSWWRSVASSYTIFAKECFVDELAHAAGRDPLELRLGLLTDPSEQATRLRAVLRLAAEKAGWGRRMADRHGLGIACRSGQSCSAHVAEVAVDDRGTVRVVRVVSAVDCGIPVNPDGVKAMTEGGINFALTAVLLGEITIDGGRVKQSNFHDYPVLRFHQAPEVDVHIIPSVADPSGVGELAVMLVAPAVANAVFAATGVRVRRLPIDARALQGT